LIQMGEIIFGGAGSGLYSLLIYALLAVFLAGLMIGRTPQYLGKKIGPFEIKMVSIVLLIPPILILGGSALGVSTIAGRAGIFNPGTHGFTEILYGFSSTANNNGSAFAGLTANTPFYNILFGIIMAIKKFGSILAILAIAGSLAAKKRLRTTSASLPTHGILFIFMIIGTVILIDILTFFPSLALGPLAEWMSQ